MEPGQNETHMATASQPSIHSGAARHIMANAVTIIKIASQSLRRGVRRMNGDGDGGRSGMWVSGVGWGGGG